MSEETKDPYQAAAAECMKRVNEDTNAVCADAVLAGCVLKEIREELPPPNGYVIQRKIFVEPGLLYATVGVRWEPQDFMSLSDGQHLVFEKQVFL